MTVLLGRVVSESELFSRCNTKAESENNSAQASKPVDDEISNLY